MFKAVLFDLDGTLISLGHDTYINQFVGLFNNLLTKKCGINHEPLTDQETYQYFANPYQESHDNLKALGVNDVSKFWQDFAKIDQAARARLLGKAIVPYPDSIVVLDLLTSFKIPMGIVTNTPLDITLMELEKFNMMKYFRKENIMSYCYSEPGSKPSGNGINRLLENLGVTNKDACMIGDGPMDIRAGFEAGVLTGQLLREGHNHYAGPKPHVEAENLLKIWEKLNEMQMRL
jgi:HAD superfamily hydrolase (TIGR01549 family)